MGYDGALFENPVPVLGKMGKGKGGRAPGQWLYSYSIYVPRSIDEKA
jgi:hypothetical protein